MKRILSILLFFCIIFSNFAQSNHVFKAKVIGGAFIAGKYTYYCNPNGLAMKSPSPVAGLEFNYEILPLGENSWEAHWNYPSIGFATLALKLDNFAGNRVDNNLGYMIAAYPYVNIPFYRSNTGEIGAKVGMGVAFFNKLNAGLGSYAAINFGFGINGKINLSDKIALTIDATYNPLTNANIYSPNSQMNIVYGALGIYYRMGRDKYRLPINRRPEDLEYKFMINGTASMTFRELNTNKETGNAMQATIHIDGLKKSTNCWATGAAIDAVIMNDGIRMGIAWANGFTMGRVTGLLDAGINIYDKQKDLNGKSQTFKFNEFKYFSASGEKQKEYEKLNGSLYLRLGARYRIINNFYIQVSGRSFLHAFDCAEFGVGYSIPYDTSKKTSYNRRRY